MGERDTAALVEEHLPLVKHLVFQVAVHLPRHVDRGELAQAGALGLLEAAQRWEEDRGVPFPRFAATRIKGAMLDAVRRADWAPRSVRTAGRTLEQATASLRAQGAAAPTAEQLADATGLSVAEVRRIQAKVQQSIVLALDQTVSGSDDEDEAVDLADVLSAGEASDPAAMAERRELHALLRDAVASLPPKHRLVVAGHFFEGLSYEEMARQLDVTPSRISQLRTEALTMIREGLDSQFAPTEAESDHVVPVPPLDDSPRVARRKAAYAASIASRQTWKARLDHVALSDSASRAI